MFDNDRHAQKQNTILKLHGLKLCTFFCKFVEYQNDAGLGCVCIIVGHSLTKSQFPTIAYESSNKYIAMKILTIVQGILNYSLRFFQKQKP